MTTQQSDGPKEHTAIHETFRQRSAHVSAAIADFTRSRGRAPSDSEVLDVVRDTRPDKTEVFEIPPFAEDVDREYYGAVFIKPLAFLVVSLMFLLGLLGLAISLAVEYGWLSPHALGP